VIKVTLAMVNPYRNYLAVALHFQCPIRMEDTMADDNIRFENIEGTQDDELDPFEANNLDDSLRSAGDRDTRDPYQQPEQDND
jgi:hypothetical protein